MSHLSENTFCCFYTVKNTFAKVTDSDMLVFMDRSSRWLASTGSSSLVSNFRDVYLADVTQSKLPLVGISAYMMPKKSANTPKI